MRSNHVAILHDELTESASKDALDVLEQVKVVSQALEELGYAPRVLPFSLDLPRFIEAVGDPRPTFAFNLVESVAEEGKLIHLAPTILDYLGIPYSGCPKEAIFVTSSKLLTKDYLLSHGIDTPGWLSLQPGGDHLTVERGDRFLLKPVWEHASIGLDESAIVSGVGKARLREALAAKKARTGREHFAERFVEGREFNVGILAGDPLPVPEIRFVDYPEGKLRVVDYKAKWEADSFEYTHTVRTFELEPGDEPLIERLRATALECWRLFGLRGYARVDFRVDASGRPWVLEININPCLSPDAGFYASALRAGWSFAQVVRRIIDDIAP